MVEGAVTGLIDGLWRFQNMLVEGEVRQFTFTLYVSSLTFIRVIVGAKLGLLDGFWQSSRIHYFYAQTVLVATLTLVGIEVGGLVGPVVGDAVAGFYDENEIC